MWADVPARPTKSDSIPIFCQISHSSAYQVWKKKNPILTKLDAFYNNLPKIHPIYVIWAPSSLMNTPDRYTKFREKAPQKAGTYTFTMSMWEPPPNS